MPACMESIDKETKQSASSIFAGQRRINLHYDFRTLRVERNTDEGLILMRLSLGSIRKETDPICLQSICNPHLLTVDH